VHRGPKGGDHLEAHFDALRFRVCLGAPALAHRLDRDTSGCLVLGRHRKALEALGLLFKQGRIGKTYWGGRRGRAGGGRRADRSTARPSRPRPARLVDEGRSRRPALAHPVGACSAGGARSTARLRPGWRWSR
jgi:23S rRNA-/tRNA-specific pseudouridylate synthase